MKISAKIAFIALALIFAALTFIFADGSVYQSLSSNLFTGFLGTLLTVWLIDDVAERQQRKREARILKTAMERLRWPLDDYVSSWVSIFKATLEQVPSPIPTKLEELLTPENLKQLEYFNAYRPAAVYPPTSWAGYMLTHLTIIRRQVEAILTRYIAVIPAEHIHTIEIFVTSPYFERFPTVLTDAVQKPNEASHLMIGLIDGNPTPELSPIIREHLDHLLELVNLYNSLSDPEARITLAKDAWQPYVGPKLGSSRYTVLPGRNYRP